jgi:hypothetical protein
MRGWCRFGSDDYGFSSVIDIQLALQEVFAHNERYVSGFQPLSLWRAVTWACGPGWHGTGLRPLPSGTTACLS